MNFIFLSGWEVLTIWVLYYYIFMNTWVLIIEDQPSTTRSVVASENIHFTVTKSLLGAIRHLIAQKLPPNIYIIDPSWRHVDNTDERMTPQEKAIFQEVFMKSWGNNIGKMLLEVLGLRFPSFPEPIHILSTARGESDNQNVARHAKQFPWIQVTTRGQIWNVDDNEMVRIFLKNTEIK